MSMVGSGAQAQPSRIKMFLRAGTAEELVSLQIHTNFLLKGEASFTDIQYVNKEWFAWFLVDVLEHPEIAGGIDGVAKESLR